MNSNRAGKGAVWNVIFRRASLGQTLVPREDRLNRGLNKISSYLEGRLGRSLGSAVNGVSALREPIGSKNCGHFGQGSTIRTGVVTTNLVVGASLVGVAG